MAAAYLVVYLAAAVHANIDCDASVIMLGANDKLQNNKDVVYFGNLKSMDGSVQHSGDNLTGDGDGDDEQVIIDLSRYLPIFKSLFGGNIYDCVKEKAALRHDQECLYSES